MLSKERVAAVILAIAVIPVIIVPVEMGWVSNLREFASLVVSGLVVAMVAGAGALWWRGGKQRAAQEITVAQRTHSGILHWHDRRSELEEAKRRVIADLEGECNRHTETILLAGGPAANELRVMLAGLRYSWWRPNDSIGYEFRRANAIRAVELAHNLPDPLNPDDFTSKRFDHYRKDVHRRYGY